MNNNYKLALVFSLKNINIVLVCLFSFFLGTGHEKLTVFSLLAFTLFSILEYNFFFFNSKAINKGFLFLYIIIIIYALIHSEYLYIERNVSFILFPLLVYNLSKEVTKKIIIFFSLGLISYPIFILAYFFIFNLPSEKGLPLDFFNLYEIKRALFSTTPISYKFHNVYYSVYSICSIIFLYFTQKHKKNIWILILFHLFFIAVSATRISYIIIFLLFVFYVINKLYLGQKKMLFYIPLVLGVLFFFAYNFPYLKHKFIKTLPYAFDTRLKIWMNTITVFQENIFGVGFLEFHDMLDIKNIKELKTTTSLNAHNQYLEYFAGLGIFGGVYFIVLLLSIIRKAIINNNRILVIFMAVMTTSFLTESWLIRQYGIVFFMFFLSLFYNNKNEEIIT